MEIATKFSLTHLCAALKVAEAEKTKIKFSLRNESHLFFGRIRLCSAVVVVVVDVKNSAVTKWFRTVLSLAHEILLHNK